MEVTSAEKRAIVNENLRVLAQKQYDLSVAKRVAEKCGNEKKLESAIRGMTDVEKEIDAYKEVLEAIED